MDILLGVLETAPDAASPPTLDGLAVHVADRGDRGPSRLAGGGHRLIGMRERLGVWGGEVTSGPGAGWEVAAQLPLGRASASVP
jgi:hypothetical protein